MFAFYVLLLCVVLMGVYFHYKYKKYDDIRKLPGPPGHPIFGHMFALTGDIDDIFEKMISLNKTYGPVIKIWANPFKPMIIAGDAKYVEIFLGGNTHLDKSDVYKNFRPFLGNALVSANVERWKRDRKIINPSFNTKILENFIPVLEYHGHNFIETLRKYVDKPFVDIVPLVDLFVLDVINDSIMRTRTNFLDKADMDYLEARNGFLHIFMDRMYSYPMQKDWIFRLTSSYKRQEKYAKKLRNYARKILMERKEEKRRNNPSDFAEVNGRKVLIDVLLDTHLFTDDEIIDQVNMFVVAGHDTPASALAFVLYEIAKHPKIQKKILDETIEVLGKSKDVAITFHDLQQMKYLECVLKESMRHYTTLPFFDRKSETDVVIDGVKIPKGTDISICAYHLHHDERYFPDPYKFDPDRFMPENVDKILPFTYIPFSLGPRNCIGKNFSMLQMKSAMAKVLRNFELHPICPEHKLKYTSEFVLKSKTGLPIRMTERKLL